MNTAHQYHSDFFGVAPSGIGLRIRNDEVVGSIPTSSTIFSSTCKPSTDKSCHSLSHKTEPARLELPQNSTRGQTFFKFPPNSRGLARATVRPVGTTGKIGLVV